MQEVQDGGFAIKINGGDRDGEVIETDLLLLVMALEEVEQRLADANGEFPLNGAFYVDLSTAFAEVTGYCTPTMAASIHTAVRDQWKALKKNINSPLNSPASMESTSSVQVVEN